MEAMSPLASSASVKALDLPLFLLLVAMVVVMLCGGIILATAAAASAAERVVGLDLATIFFLFSFSLFPPAVLEWGVACVFAWVVLYVCLCVCIYVPVYVRKDAKEGYVVFLVRKILEGCLMESHDG